MISITTIKQDFQDRIAAIGDEIKESRTVINNCKEVIEESEQKIRTLNAEHDNIMSVYKLLNTKPSQENNEQS